MTKWIIIIDTVVPPAVTMQCHELLTIKRSFCCAAQNV